MKILQNDPNVITISDVFDWKEFDNIAMDFYTEKKNKWFNVWASPMTKGQDCIVFIITED